MNPSRTDLTNSSQPDADEETETVLALFTDAIRAGRHPSVASLVAEHPHLAERIQALIPPLLRLEKLATDENVALTDASLKRELARQQNGPR